LYGTKRWDTHTNFQIQKKKKKERIKVHSPQKILVRAMFSYVINLTVSFRTMHLWLKEKDWSLLNWWSVMVGFIRKKRHAHV